MAKIDRLEELPEWFSLDKYRGCESFGAVQWYEQLARRASILSWAKMPEDWLRPGSSSLEVMAKEAAAVRACPVGCGPSERERTITRHPVNTITGFDLWLQAERDRFRHGRTEELSHLAERWAIIGDGDIPARTEPIAQPLTLNIFGSNKPCIWVDLDAPDAVILASFRKWLADTRAVMGTAAPKRPLYDRWARYGLLPYLDLHTWALEQQAEITWDVMAAACWPNAVGGAESMRKTVAPLAAYLMADLSPLATLAAAEAASKPAPETSES